MIKNLEDYNEDVVQDIDQDDIVALDDRKHESNAFISKTHSNIINRFKHLDKAFQVQQDFSTKSHMMQDIVEDFIILANKLKHTEYALQQIEIMKDYSSR